MPNKQNAKKALRQAQKRAVRNNEVKTAYKKAVKEVNKLVATGEKEMKEQMRMAQKFLDKAAKKGVLKKRTAGRKLSRLMKRAHKAVKAK